LSRGEIDSPNSFPFAAKIADCDLKYCILKQNANNNITGGVNNGREYSGLLPVLRFDQQSATAFYNLRLAGQLEAIFAGHHKGVREIFR
jgi:hypothetical protein